MSDLQKERIKHIYDKKLNTRIISDNLGDTAQFQFLYLFINKYDKNTRILDAGCGSGMYASAFMEIGYDDIYCVDLFDEHINKSLNYSSASVDELPFADDFFDLLYSTSVIYYLDYPEDAIREYNRVLKIGGMVILTVVTKYSFYTLWRLLKRKIGLKSASHIEPYHFRYTYKDYCRMMEDNGFEIVYINGFSDGKLYERIRGGVKRLTLGKVILHKNWISNKPAIGKFKALFSYHAVIVGKKGGSCREK